MKEAVGRHYINYAAFSLSEEAVKRSAPRYPVPDEIQNGGCLSPGKGCELTLRLAGQRGPGRRAAERFGGGLRSE